MPPVVLGRDLAAVLPLTEAEVFLADPFGGVVFSSLGVVSEAADGFVGTATTDGRCLSSKPLTVCLEAG